MALLILSCVFNLVSEQRYYCLYVPEDESPIDVNGVLRFYQTLVSRREKSEIISEIRGFAEKYCDISRTMLPVIEYIDE